VYYLYNEHRTSSLFTQHCNTTALQQNTTTTPHHHITTSPHHHITTSPHHHITTIMTSCNAISATFPGTPKFTEAHVPDLSSKVYIVTGGSSGVGKELARLLYSRNGTVYIAGRNAENGSEAIKWMQQSHPESKGSLHFLQLDLNDLTTIKSSAEAFLAKSSRLDILFNNAGVMLPPKGSTTKQGYELQLGTNCVAPFLFTKLLTPLLVRTAQTSPAGSVRVIWVSSGVVDIMAGVDMENVDYKNKNKKQVSDMELYSASKAGNVLQAIEFARRYKSDGVVSIVSPLPSLPTFMYIRINTTQALNPGNLKTPLQRHFSPAQRFVSGAILHPPVNGAYTNLYAGLAPEAADIKEGQWVQPWGRVRQLKKEYVGTVKAGQFWEWCEGEVRAYE
jgi:retinol dehydrogenase-12